MLLAKVVALLLVFEGCMLKFCRKTNNLRFLGAFTKLQKATVSFVMSTYLSVRPSVRMRQLDSHRIDFNEILYFSVFEKLSRKLNFH